MAYRDRAGTDHGIQGGEQVRGPSGFWCRHCGAYQSTRTRQQAKAAIAHGEACGERAANTETKEATV